MRGRILLGGCAVAAFVAAAAQAAGPGFSVSVSPTLVTIAGSGSGTIDVSNPSDQATVVDVTLGNYAIERDGTVLVDPPEPPNRTAKAWISVRPQTLRLGPNAHAEVTVTSHPPAHAEPGDHHALVLLATPPGKGEVGVRTQVGVGVLVRMPGKIERKLAVARLAVHRAGNAHTLALTIENRGNVNELLEPGRVRLTLEQHGKMVETLVLPGFDLLPASRITKTVSYRGHAKGRTTVAVTVTPLPASKDGPGIVQTLAPVHAVFEVNLG